MNSHSNTNSDFLHLNVKNNLIQFYLEWQFKLSKEEANQFAKTPIDFKNQNLPDNEKFDPDRNPLIQIYIYETISFTDPKAVSEKELDFSHQIVVVQLENVEANAKMIFHSPFVTDSFLFSLFCIRFNKHLPSWIEVFAIQVAVRINFNNRENKCVAWGFIVVFY